MKARKVSGMLEALRAISPYPAEAAGGKIVYQAEFDEDGNIEDMGDLEIEPLIDNEEDSEAENQ